METGFRSMLPLSLDPIVPIASLIGLVLLQMGFSVNGYASNLDSARPAERFKKIRILLSKI